MKLFKTFIVSVLVLLTAFSTCICAFAADETIPSTEIKTTEVFRLYNWRSGEHFYTSDVDEKNYLFEIGWNFEQSWFTVEKSDVPVYRLYNSNAGDHLYTINYDEVEFLVDEGWKFEGIAFYSASFDSENEEESKVLPMYRQYNPNATTGTHNYTPDESEHKYLISVGWRGEGVAFYILSVSDAAGEVSPANIYAGLSSAESMRINMVISASQGEERAAYVKALSVLINRGFDLRRAYEWSYGIQYQTMTVDPSPGCAYFANYGFDTYNGNCYVYASTFYYMAKLLDYDAHFVVGYVLSGGSRNQNHGWVEIDMNGKTYVFDSEFENSMARRGYQRNGYMFTYGTKGTWRYVDYYRVN